MLAHTMFDPEAVQRMFLNRASFETDSVVYLATCVVDGELATFDVEPVRSKRGFRQ